MITYNLADFHIPALPLIQPSLDRAYTDLRPRRPRILSIQHRHRPREEPAHDPDPAFLRRPRWKCAH